LEGIAREYGGTTVLENIATSGCVTNYMLSNTSLSPMTKISHACARNKGERQGGTCELAGSFWSGTSRIMTHTATLPPDTSKAFKKGAKIMVVIVFHYKTCKESQQKPSNVPADKPKGSKHARESTATDDIYKVVVLYQTSSTSTSQVIRYLRHSVVVFTETF
jgi:hypothetical protein